MKELDERRVLPVSKTMLNIFNWRCGQGCKNMISEKNLFPYCFCKFGCSCSWRGDFRHICEGISAFFPVTVGSEVGSGSSALDTARSLMAVGSCMFVGLTVSALGLERFLYGGSKETTMLRRQVRLRMFLLLPGVLIPGEKARGGCFVMRSFKLVR